MIIQWRLEEGCDRSGPKSGYLIVDVEFGKNEVKSVIDGGVKTGTPECDE